MKTIILIIIGLALHFLTSAQDMKGMDMPGKSKPTQASATYTCVMHPKIHSAKPGNCPVCGMKLIKEKPKALPQAVPLKSVKEMNMRGNKKEDDLNMP